MQHKLLLALGLTLLTAGLVYVHNNIQGDRDESARAQFETWKRNYGRKYGALEDEYRFQIFKQNLEFVDNHNKQLSTGEQTYEVDLNNFADISNEEYQARYLTKIGKKTKGNKLFVPTGSRPDEVDWREKQVVSPVKNQGSCGSCWAFSAVGALEGLYHLNGQQLEFSEQELVDCSKSYQNEGCNGGMMDWAFQYVVDHGISTESEYPYTGRDGKCASAGKSRHNISGFTDVEPENQEALLEAIAQQPVSVAVNAGGLGFQFYRRGVFGGSCASDPDHLNHGVLAAGYGQLDGKPFYLVKNSWGTTWGDSGYIRLAINNDKYGQCGIQNVPSFPNL